MSQSTTTHRVNVRPESTRPVVPAHQRQSEEISLSSLPTHQLLTDGQLLQLCTHYGTQAKLWKQKFLGLLPEVEKRKLYLEKGCSSLFEFAAKLGGVSKEQVSNVLRLYQRFESTPVLQQALVSGEVSVNKLARVVSVATPENQEHVLHQSHLLSNRALETLVQDTKRLHVQTKKPSKTEKISQSDELNLAPDVRQLLLDMQNKGIDHNQVLRELLKERNQRVQQEKQTLAQELEQKEKKEGMLPSRYIPQKIKHLLKQEYGDKCAQEYCINKSTHTHHTRRFGLNPSHNPLFLAPLCNQHHEIAHALDVRVQERRRREVTGPAMGTPRPSGHALVAGKSSRVTAGLGERGYTTTLLFFLLSFP